MKKLTKIQTNYWPRGVNISLIKQLYKRRFHRLQMDLWNSNKQMPFNPYELFFNAHF